MSLLYTRMRCTYSEPTGFIRPGWLPPKRNSIRKLSIYLRIYRMQSEYVVKWPGGVRLARFQCHKELPSTSPGCTTVQAYAVYICNNEYFRRQGPLHADQLDEHETVLESPRYDITPNLERLCKCINHRGQPKGFIWTRNLCAPP